MARPVDPIYEQIGQRVRSLREAHRIRQDELAAAIGLGRTSISNLEAGRQEVPLPTLIRVAERLETRLAVLVGDVPMPAIPHVSVLRRYVVRCAVHGDLGLHDDERKAEDGRSAHMRDHLADPPAPKESNQP